MTLGAPGIGRLPGVQLEGRVAARLARQGKAGVRLGRIEATFEVVADHRARVGRHFVARCAEQTVDWLPEHLAGQVPQGQVDGRQHAVRQGAQMQALALLERVPDTLAIKGVLADQHRRDDLLDGAGADATEVVSARAVIGGDGQQGLHRVLLLARGVRGHLSLERRWSGTETAGH